MLTATQLTKQYRTAHGDMLTVLDHVSFELEPGDTFSIVGPSGSGKTTLLGLCAGLDRASSGSVELNGVRLDDLSEDDRAAVDAYLGAHGPVLGFVGVPLSVVKRVAVWPAWAIDVAVTDLFKQTPGPGAGERLGGGPR